MYFIFADAHREVGERKMLRARHCLIPPVVRHSPLFYSNPSVQWFRSDLKTEASFFSSAKVLRESRGSSAEEFCF